MKKTAIIYTAAVLTLTICVSVFIRVLAYNAQESEIIRVQNIAGAVLSKYPQAELNFMDGVTDDEYKYIDYGKSAVSHYGYDTEMELNSRYTATLSTYYFVAALILAAVLGSGYSIFALTAKRKREWEKNLLSVLECCMAGDSSFVSNRELMRKIENTLFSDSLIKLTESINLKTQYLAQEHDNTKTLVTDISHQLKTPISAMKACFDMYINADNEDERNEFLSRSKIQMDKLENLSAALINVSRLENGMITLQKTKTALSKVLIEAVNTVYHKALKKNIDIETSDFDDIYLCLDMKWTAEAIANILDNAVKYSPEGSGIRIRVQKMYSFARIEIEDSGIGICGAEKNKIFQRFYRGNNELVKNEEGSGIGLYLTRKILEDQGGTVSVRSARGKGSIFVIQLAL